MKRRYPLGPGGSYKTGQRVPHTGDWHDQHGVVVGFEADTTFPPCVGFGRKGECAFWLPVAEPLGEVI